MAPGPLRLFRKPEPSDGKRILVMTMWPRGISKEKVDIWMKDLGTPRKLIREWKGGKISWERYKVMYRRSLEGKEESLWRLAEESRKGTVTLLCTEKDPEFCHRSLLKSAIERLRTTSS